LPEWNFDGSSTNQAPGDNSEVLLRPQAVFPDPFRQGRNILVLCDCVDPEGNPLPTNKRASAAAIFADPKVTAQKTWFGLEQEYTVYKNGRVLGWPEAPGSYPAPQGPYYCGVGLECAAGRPLVEAHYRACLFAGLKISGINMEVMPGQFEYQIGPCVGIEEGDHMWISRYILGRVAELFGCSIELDPKPQEGDWNGSGCHANFSTQAMREDGGYAVILEACERLGEKHEEHMTAYGEGNDRRMTGLHETASIDKFSYGVADRGASIRIPRETHRDQKGYLEDRRPASNICPYVVTELITSTCLAL
jgi:glutamine synthetase